jgi:30S ribosomal protein S31
MGKGDRKSTKGKIWRGSYGKSRPKTKNVKKVEPVKPEVEAEAEA